MNPWALDSFFGQTTFVWIVIKTKTQSWPTSWIWVRNSSFCFVVLQINMSLNSWKDFCSANLSSGVKTQIKTITLFKQHTPLKEGLSRNKPIIKINKKRKPNQQKLPRHLTVTSLDPGTVVWTYNSVPDTCCKITSLLALSLSLIKQWVTAVHLKVMCICYLELFYE